MYLIWILSLTMTTMTACDNWLTVAHYSAYSGRNSVLLINPTEKRIVGI
ncbi:MULTISPECIES: hypothetical protein [Peribacillus]